MTKPIFIFSVLMILSCEAYSQKEDHIWIYNRSNSYFSVPDDVWGCSVIDFNTLPPQVYENPSIILSSSETHSAYCDIFGDLKYYTNGQEIHGLDHRPITNGDTINYGPRWEVFHFTGAPNHRETNGFRGVQEAGFIPQPETDTILALYQNTNDFFVTGDDFNYHLMQAKIVDNGSGGIVVSKDEVINDSIRIKGTITTCTHANGRDQWLLQFTKDTVYTYLVTPLGVALDFIQTLPFELIHPFTGQSKFSPEGDYFSIHGVHTFNSDTGKGLMIAGFDRCTGELIDPQLDILHSHDNLLSNGVEFSPNGDLLYISNGNSIRQYDLLADNIFSSMQIVAENNGINTCSIDNGPGPHWFGQIQLAPDKQIYISLAAQCNDVHIIRHPNVRGVGCEVEQNAIILPTFVFGTIPNTNTYRLGPLDGSSCDTLGLDNHPVSRYWYEQDSFDFLTAQFWDVSYFRPEQWLWDFGDGMTSTDRHPQHSYADKGIYEVCLNVSNENSSNTSCQTLYLGVSDTEDLEEKISLSIYPNPTEGLTRLVLSDYLPEQGVVSFYDISGAKVLLQRIHVGATVIDMSGLDLGTYVYEVRDGGKLIGGGKVVRI